MFLQAFRESAMPEASELLQQLADAKTEEDKEAIKAVVVSLLVKIKFHETGQTVIIIVTLFKLDCSITIIIIVHTCT